VAYKTTIVSSSQVPDWERKPPKWTDLAEQATQLVPGQALRVAFEDHAVAERARNAIRDHVNLTAKQILVRTRLIKEPDGTTTLYIMRVTQTTPK
jgi:hypothetical protein